MPNRSLRPWAPAKNFFADTPQVFPGPVANRAHSPKIMHKNRPQTKPKQLPLRADSFYGAAFSCGLLPCFYFATALSFQMWLSGNFQNDKAVSTYKPLPLPPVPLPPATPIGILSCRAHSGPLPEHTGNIQQQQNPPRKRLRIGNDAVSKNACKGV